MIGPLEGRVWYRILKVLFLLALIASLFIVGLIAHEEKPYEVIDNEQSNVRCTGGINAGKFFLLDKNLFYLLNPWLSSYEAINARKLCDYDKLGVTYDNRFPDKGVLNYELVIVNKTIGSWNDVVRAGVKGIGIVLVVSWLIRGIFFYVATGKFAAK